MLPLQSADKYLYLSVLQKQNTTLKKYALLITAKHRSPKITLSFFSISPINHMRVFPDTKIMIALQKRILFQDMQAI